ncbi:hypothetical protein [Humibacillus xanthopallidus]|uniref:hypothetical protein n=1 Tax=Humibacillus xanthopallidus TaxID=412689 RepID=UPI00384AD7AC
MRTTTRIAGASIAAAASLALAVGPAFAADSWVSANLKPVAGNGVQGSGTAQVTISGTEVKVEMAATGLLPDQPHAAHIHYGEAARHECPTLGDDTNDDHHLNTTEGGPAYGDIVVSLTKTGDTSPKSGLAVDRFDTAPGGKISYERGRINVTSAVAEDIASGEAAIVIHGVDYNKDGKYSGDTKSDLDPTLPTEATDPALCGVLVAAPAGGMQTGGGMSSTTNDNGMLLAVGGVALVAAAGSGAVAARRARARG